MTMMTVRVIGLTWGCWKCGQSTVCVLGPSSGGLRDFESSDEAIELARRILIAAGQPEIAGRLRDSANGIASHCAACGAIQGNWYLHKEALERTYWEDDEAAYDVLAEGSVERSDWHRIEEGLW